MQGASPILAAPRLGAAIGVDLWVKRDDLLPVPGGGSKLRAASRILDAAAGRHDAVVTSGGTQSNHARVVALEAARRGWPCRLVLHGDERALADPRGNLLLMVLAGAQVDIAPTERTEAAIEDAMADLRDRGYDPLLIPGGAHGVEGVLAYVDAAVETAGQLRAAGWQPDRVVLASGTGTLHAGLLAGFMMSGLRTSVHGISIARQNPRGSVAVGDAYVAACDRLGLMWAPETVHFDDRWTGGGYERPAEGVDAVIDLAARTEGLLLDPTYTGKAFRGLVGAVEEGAITRGAKVLFWHSGGMLNLLAAGHAVRSTPR